MTIRKGIWFIILLVAWLMSRNSSATPPNDNFADAQKLFGNYGALTNLSTVGGTTEALEGGVAPTIWFRYDTIVPSTGGIFLVNPPATGMTVAVYEQGDAGPVLLGTSVTSPYFMSVRAAAGKSYYYMVRTSNTNLFGLQYYFPTLYLSKPSPSATVLAPGPTALEFGNNETGATFQSVTVWAQNFSLPPVAVATGTMFPLSFMWTNQIGGSVAIWMRAVAADGTLRTSLTNGFQFRPAHNNFAAAVDLDPIGGDFYVAITNATREVGEPRTGSPGSVWYRWQPEISGMAQFDIRSPTNSQYALYTAGVPVAVTNLTEIALTAMATNSTVLQAPVEAGTTYYLATYQTVTGLRKLRYSITSMDFLIGATNLTAPGVLDLAVGPVPAGASSVEYILGTNRLAQVNEPPFVFHWTNVLTGFLPIYAVAHTVGSGDAYSKAILLNIVPGNDSRETAVELSPSLRNASFSSSALLATNNPGEPGKSIWYHWVPDRSGFATVSIVENTPNLSIATTNTLTNFTARSVSQLVQGGSDYWLLFTDSSTNIGAFNWSVQNSPLQIPDLFTNRYNENHPIEVIPVALGPVDEIANVQLFQNGQVIASATAAPFKLAWNGAALGTNAVDLRVTLTGGATVSGGSTRYVFHPANDEAEGAKTLSSDVLLQTIQQDARYASSNPADLLNSQRSLWWRWVAPGNARVSIKTDVSGGYVGIFRTGPGGILETITLATQFGGSFLFNAHQGETYLFVLGAVSSTVNLTWHLEVESIALVPMGPLKTPFTFRAAPLVPTDVIPRIGLYSSESPVGTLLPPDYSFTWTEPGTYQVTLVGTNQDGIERHSLPITLALSPGNDNIADAIEIPANPTSLSFTNSFWNSTAEPGEPWGPSIWWRWTPAYAGRTTIILDSTPFYSAGAVVTTSRDFGQYTNLLQAIPSGGEFFPEPGKTYYISIFSQVGNRSQAWHLQQETLRLDVPQHRPPLDLQVFDTRGDETFVGLTLFVNDAPTLAMAPPDFKAIWSTNVLGRYVLRVSGTNNFGELRETQPVEYWVGPTNDFFADAAELAPENGAWRARSNLGFSSLERGERPIFSGMTGSVWFKWTAPLTYSVEIAFPEGNADMANRVAVYEGGSVSNLLTHPTQPQPNQRRLFVAVEQGKTYYIAAGTSTGADEPIALEIPFPPPNDNLANATVIDDSGLFSGTTRGASDEAEEFAVVGPLPASPIWFQYYARETGNLQFFIDSNPASFFAGAIFGTNWNQARFHAVFTQGGTIFRALKGETYSIAVYGGPGPFTGHVSFVPVNAPVNDFRRNETLLEGTNILVSGTLVNTTREITDRFDLNQTLWWKWVSPGRGRLLFWTEQKPPLGHTYVRTYVGDVEDTTGDMIVDLGTVVEILMADGRDPNQSPLFNLHLQFDAFREPAANDVFANRLQITPGQFSNDSTTYGAAREAGEYGGEANTVWWEINPPTNGVAVIEMTPTAAGTVRVFRGTNQTNLVLVAQGSSMTVNLTNGVPLQLQVAGNSPHNFTLNVRTYYAPPINDKFTESIHLEGTNVSSSGVNYMATQDPGEPAYVQSQRKSVWWSWYAKDAGVVTFFVQAPFLPQTYIYKGFSVSSLKVVTNRTDNNAFFTFAASAETIYHVRVDSAEPVQGLISIGVTEDVYPRGVPNDNFADAMPLRGAEAGAHVSNVSATIEPGEPAVFSARRKSIWFDWQGPGGTTAVTVSGWGLTNFGTIVYTGDSFEKLQLVAAGTTSVSFLADTRKRYKIAVETPPEQSGMVDMTIAGGKNWGSYPGGNLLQNGSFETGGLSFDPWGVEGGVYDHFNDVAPLGRNRIVMEKGRIWQDIPTIPGSVYEARCIVWPLVAPAYISFLWDDQASEPAAVASYATYPRAVFQATGTTTRFQLVEQGGPFQGAFEVDGVSVVPYVRPPAADPMGDLTVQMGTDAAFLSKFTGTDPISFQWFYRGQRLEGQTNASLFFKNSTPSQSGQYYVIASNPFGFATNAATLLVQEVSPPTIVFQPEGRVAAAGERVSLCVIPNGSGALQYEWFHNGRLIEGATENHVVFNPVNAADAGDYVVRVSNAGGSIVSLPATIRVGDHQPEAGDFLFQNDDPARGTQGLVSAPFGELLAGSQFWMQLYVGESLETLRPMGSPQPFLGGFSSGRIAPARVPLPGFAAGENLLWQYRAWDAARGVTYEEARVAGGNLGQSAAQPFTAPGLGGEFAPNPLSSFALRLGRPSLAPARLEGAARDGNVLTFHLQAPAGFRYLLEKREGASDWQSVQLIEIRDGPIDVTQTVDSTKVTLFRTRILSEL